MSYKLTNEQFISKSINRFGDFLDYSLVEYKSSRIPVLFKCPIHGEFEQKPNTHLNSKKPCPKCSKNTEIFIRKAKEKHGDKYEYFLVNYISINKHVKIVCPEHGIFKQTPANHYKHGCSKCNKSIKTTKDFIREAVAIHNGKYDYSKTTYNGAHFKLKIICPSHGLFLVSPTNHLHAKQGCSACSERISKSEKKQLDSVGSEDKKQGSNLSENSLIIHSHKLCQFKTEDLSIGRLLREKFCYKQHGAEYTKAYRTGWDGIIYLINKQGFFKKGLLDKVRSFLNENSIYYDEKDLSPKVITNKSLDIESRLQELSLAPREHQVNILKATNISNNGIIRSCTGSGKTLASAMIVANINKPTIVYVIGLDLLNQFHNLFSSIFDEKIGYIGDGICDIRRINIASIWTIGAALKIDGGTLLDGESIDKEDFKIEHRDNILGLLAKTKVHILDESHIVATNTISRIYSCIDPEFIYGMSGTPFREDGKNLVINSILGNKIIDVTASQLIKKELLVTPKISFKTVPPIRFAKSKKYQTIYKEYIVENNKRNTIIVDELIKLVHDGRKPLVLFRNISHGQRLLSMMEDKGLKVSMLSGKNSIEERNSTKLSLERGEIKAILASTIFDIGVDIPFLDALILAGGGRSKIKSIQRVGRVIRPFKGKKDAIIIDFYDQCRHLKKHSIIRYNNYTFEEGFIVNPCQKMMN